MDSKSLPWVLLGIAVVGGGLWYMNQSRAAAATVASQVPGTMVAPPPPPVKRASTMREIGRMLDPTISGSIGNQALTSILGAVFK